MIKFILGSMNGTELEKHLQSDAITMFGAEPPARRYQSRWIALWSNVDIYYAMNYILSSFCTEFDEFAVVTLLKQLSVCGGTYLKVIKCVWNMLSVHVDIRDALFYSDKLIASYSLNALAVFDSDQQTMMKLFYAAIREGANQRIKFATYSAMTNTLLTSRASSYSRTVIRILYYSTMNCREIKWRLKSGDRDGKTKNEIQSWFGKIIELCNRHNLSQISEAARFDWLIRSGFGALFMRPMPREWTMKLLHFWTRRGRGNRVEMC